MRGPLSPAAPPPRHPPPAPRARWLRRRHVRTGSGRYSPPGERRGVPARNACPRSPARRRLRLPRLRSVPRRHQTVFGAGDARAPRTSRGRAARRPRAPARRVGRRPGRPGARPRSLKACVPARAKLTGVAGSTRRESGGYAWVGSSSWGSSGSSGGRSKRAASTWPAMSRQGCGSSTTCAVSADMRSRPWCQLLAIDRHVGVGDHAGIQRGGAPIRAAIPRGLTCRHE